jgi:hypothetical protein
VSRNTLAFLTVALTASSMPAADLLPADRPIAEAIDHYVGLKLKQAGVGTAAQADDATLVRRLTLDLAGRIPTPAEAKGYIDSKDPDKRAKLIDRLMAAPDFVRHGATEFDALLRSGNDQAPSLRGYLLTALRENRPWDRMFRELMGSSPDPSRPDHFVLKRLGDPDVLTRDVSAIFFGLNIMCAQCHKHPYVSSITQDYYHGMKAFFSRTLDFQGQLWEKRHALVQYKARSGQLRTPPLMFLSGKVLDEPKPDVPDLPKAIEEENKRIEELRKNFAKAKQYPPKPAFNYREQLVEVALRPGERDRFARSIVNRLWHRFHGLGLVMRLDQMHPQNPPSHPELLDWLARDLIAHGYDLRRLVRGLVASQAYSRASSWDKGTPPAPALFAVAQLRPLTSGQFGLSALLAGDPDSLPADLPQEARDSRLQALETEAQKVFGPIIEQPRDGLEINVSEGLRLSNDEAVLRILGDRLAGRLLKAGDRKSQIEMAVWAILSRPPTEEEINLLGEYVARHTPGEAELARQADETRRRREAVERAKARVAEIEREIAELNSRHREAVLRSELARTEKYLAAAAELRLGPAGAANTPETLAAKHGLDAFLLRRWHGYLGRPVAPSAGPAVADAVVRGHYTTRLTKTWGHTAVNGWGTEATPWLVANASNEPIRYGTLTLPPRSVSTHPSPTLAAAVSWRSPLDGVVRVSGRVADVDPNCGNGIGWSLVVHREGQKETLAGGNLDNGRSVLLDPAALGEVRVRRGDVLSLVVDPRDGNHACDSTHVEFVLTEQGGKGRKWDLAADVVDSIHAGNPHADGHGNAGVWHFHTIETSSSSASSTPTLPAGSVLARWTDAVLRIRQGKVAEAAGREELSRIAAEAAKVLTSPPPAARSDPNAAILRELASVSGPLFGGIDFPGSLDAGAKAKLAQWNAELEEARREAARPLPAMTTEPPAQRALRQMVWALLAGAEFRFNH